jgi:hypothetical protein
LKNDELSLRDLDGIGALSWATHKLHSMIQHAIDVQLAAFPST